MNEDGESITGNEKEREKEQVAIAVVERCV